MKLHLSPQDSSAALKCRSRASAAVFAVCLMVSFGACSDSQVAMRDSATSGVLPDDAGRKQDAHQGGSPNEPDEEEEDSSDAPLGPSAPDDDSGAGEREDEPDAGEAIDAAALDASAAEIDAAAEIDTGADGDSAAGGDADIGDAAPPEQDAGAQADASAADGGCAPSLPADACGVCGGDGASCQHPLAGRYAARTQFYAHQHASAGSEALDLISKGNIISVVNIDAAGVATEHYCYLELESPDGFFVWSPANTVQRIPDTTLALEARAGRYVRPLSAHRAYFGWSPQRRPTDCVTDQMHASGCMCGAPDALPASAQDCSVVDLEQDGKAGGSMFLGVERPADPNATSTDLELKIAALLNLEWSLEARGEGRLVGTIGGGMQQSVLGAEGALAEALGALDNLMCDASFGHVELVRGELDCAALLAGRSANPGSFGVFDLSLDPAAPASVEACHPAPGS